MPYFQQLCDAITHNDYKTCQTILAQSRINPEKRFDINRFNNDGYAPIHLASIFATDPDLITLLLENGANPALISPAGTALDLCIKKGNFPNQQNALAILRYVIANKLDNVDLEGTDKASETLSDHCIFRHFDTALELLSEAKKLKQARKEEKERSEAYSILLQDAIQKQNAELFSSTLESARKFSTFNVNQVIGGRTLLDHAISTENPRICQLLINAGADLNLPSNGKTAIRQIFDIIKSKTNRTAASYGFKGPLRDILSMIINGSPPHAGANLRERSDIYNGVPYSMLAELAISFKLEDLNITRPDVIDYFKKVRDLILNAHRYDQKRAMNIHGYELGLEGLTQGITTQEALSSFNEFVTHPEVRSELNDLMNLSMNTKGIDYANKLGADGSIDMLTQIFIDIRGMIEPIDMKLVNDNLRNNQLVAIPLLTNVYEKEDHAQSCLLYGDFFVHINCGGTVDPKGPKGITIYHIGDKKSFMAEVPKLINSHKHSLDDSYLIGELQKKGKLKEVYTVKNVPLQIVGNCTWKATEALIRAVTFMNMLKNIRAKYNDDAFSFHIADLISDKWQDLFLKYDKNRGLKQTLAFGQNVPKGLLADMEAKFAAEQKKDKEKDKYWLNMHKPSSRKSSDAAIDASTIGDKKLNVEKKAAIEALSLNIPKSELQEIMVSRFRFGELEVKSLYEAINAEEHDTARKDLPAYITALMQLNAASITKLVENDHSVNIQFEDANAKKEFMQRFQGSQKPAGRRT